MLLRSSVYALLLSILTGCSSGTHTLGDRRWFNAALPIYLQSTLYEQEASFCAQTADQWVPIPKVTYSYSGVRLINGSPNVSVEGALQPPFPRPNSLVMASPALMFPCEAIGATLRGHREFEMSELHDNTRLETNERAYDGTPAAQ